MLNLDFSNVPTREPLEEGVYHLVVTEAAEKTSSTGNPMLTLTFNVQNVPGEHKLWNNFTLIDKALWKLKEFLEAIGMDTSASPQVQFDVAELIGTECDAMVIQELYKGEATNRIKKFLI